MVKVSSSNKKIDINKKPNTAVIKKSKDNIKSIPTSNIEKKLSINTAKDIKPKLIKDVTKSNKQEKKQETLALWHEFADAISKVNTVLLKPGIHEFNAPDKAFKIKVIITKNKPQKVNKK